MNERHADHIAYEEIKAVFSEAVALKPPDRGPFLLQRCAGRPALLCEVESLLESYERAPTFVDHPEAALGMALAGTNTDQPDEAVGQTIGPYTLKSVLGAGGFGIVWLAEQAVPVQRLVALKIIKPGMDSRAVISRFNQERQALAIMDHPHIAKVFDAGVTRTERPYFVMELVAGEWITAYCDGRRLSVRSRLELFAQVCDAVEHAHKKGIIHRDLKPANVLVSDQEGRPFSRIIDFGIAKATGAQLTGRTMFTEQGQALGTPEYMSPEQASAGQVDVDTRTDVYALGVLLYELLVGALPFDPRVLESRDADEIRRIIREDDPPTPSRQFGGLDDAEAHGLARNRRTRRDALVSELRRELEWIPLKAMRKDREDRYQTPREMADDIRNYLEGRPLVAAPESFRYLARKFVRRNRGPVAAVAAVGATLVLGIAAASVFAVREAHARRESERRRQDMDETASFQSKMLTEIDVERMGHELLSAIEERMQATGAEAGALSEAGTAGRPADPLAGINGTDIAVQLLNDFVLQPADRAARAKFAGRPLIKANVLQGVVIARLSLGRSDDVESTQREVVELFGREAGPDHPDSIAACGNLAEVLRLVGKPAEAEPWYQQALERSERVLGENDRVTQAAIHNMGICGIL